MRKHVLLCALLLCGCTEKQIRETTSVFTKQDENRTVTLEIQAQDDRMTAIHQTTVILMDGYTKEQVIEIHDRLYEAEQKYEALEGVGYSVEHTDDMITQVIDVDLDTADLSGMIEDGIVTIEGTMKPDVLSLSETARILSENGWKND
ncbi:MAG: DUF1307 domain-containing protein [Bulleidia sp.]